MSMDNQNTFKSIGGENQADVIDLNAVLAELEQGMTVLFAQGTYELTSNLTLASNVTLQIDDNVEIIGNGFELDAPEGRVIVSPTVSTLTLGDLTISGGEMNGTLLTVMAAGSNALTFDASSLTLKPGVGSAALAFERPLEGARQITVEPAGDGDAVPQTGSAFDLGSGFETTILSRVYQELQGPAALTGGLIDIRSDLSFQSATVTITEPRDGDTLSFANDAETLAGLLRVTLDYNTDTGVLSITPASGRLLNAGLVELLLESIRFENTTDKPGNSREFSYELTDKDGGTLNATAILLINDLNAAPELALNAIDESGWDIGDVTASFAQGDTAVDITTDAAISLTDAEDDAINFVTVTIDDVYDTSLESLQLRSAAAEDDLFGLSPAALAEIAGVVVSYDADSATLTIQASQDLLNDAIATTDLFAFLLNEVTYANTAANPVAGGGNTRTISVVAKDTLTQNPLASDPLVFKIGLEGDNLDAINAATTPAQMKTAIENVASQAITDLLTDQDGVYLSISSDALRDVFLQALIDNRPEENGYTTFAQFKDDFLSPLLVVVDAGLDLLAATAAIDVNDALEKAIDSIGDLRLNSVEKSDLEAAKAVFDGLGAGFKEAMAADLANNTADQDALAGNYLELAAALITYRDAEQAAVTAANDDAFAVSDLQAVSDELDAIKLINADAILYTQNVDNLIADIGGQITALQDLTDVRLQALLEDVKNGEEYTNFFTLLNTIQAVQELRTAVQNAVGDLVAAANGADPALSVETFVDVGVALQAIVNNGLTTDIDGTPVDDISAAELADAITLFEGLSQGTQDAVLARVQENTTFSDLSSVLDAVEPAIRAELLEQLNAAIDTGGVAAVLTDARAIYGNDFTDFDDLQDASESFVLEVLLASKPAEGFADFDAAVLAFGKAVSLADAVEIFVTAANAADVEGISAALTQAQGALNGLEVPGIDTTEVSQAADAFNALVEGRAQALANDLKANGGTDGWAVTDVYASNLLAFAAALVVFRTEVAEAVVAGNAGTLTSTQIDDIKTSLVNIESAKGDATINGAAIGPIIADVAQLVTDLDALVEGRFDALISDLAANGEYGSYTAMVNALQPLLDFREAVQVAVENGNDGTLELSDLRAVEDALETLGTLTVNGAAADTLVDDAKAGNDRIDALVEGRFTALIADLEANGPYGSFTALSAQLEPLLQLREALQAAVEAANANELDADLLDAVSVKLAALDGKIVNGETVDATDVTDAQTAFNALDARDVIVAAVNDPETDYTSFTQLAVAIQAVIDEVDATLVIAGDSGVDDTLAPTEGDEFIILGEVYRVNENGTFTAAEAKSLSIDPNVFVLKNLSDAQGGKADKFVPAPTEQFGNDTVAVTYADGFGADKLYGFTLGAADGRADTIDFSDLADGAALLDKITSVELGKNLTRFNEVFLSKEFLSVKITFENGSTVELIDFIALDFKPEGSGTPTLADMLGDGLADGGYAAVGGFEAANFLSLVSANLRFVITDVNEATTAAEMETALGALAAVSDFGTTLLGELGTQQKTDLLDALIANRGDGYADVSSLGAVYTLLADLYDAIDTVVKNATVEDDPLTLPDLKAVETALQVVEAEELTVVGETVTATTLGTSISQFEELRPATQLLVLAEIEGNDLNSFGDVLAAFEPALLTVGLALLNDAADDADVLGALADINVYLSDASAAALDAVFELGDAAQNALARDFLLNRPDGGFADLDAANALLVVLEDIYSGIDAAFSADAFDLSGEGAYELTVDGTTVQLANINSITFSDQTVRVVADGGFDTIQAAVDAAGSGDTVLVSQGTYDEAVTVDVEGLTITGANAGIAGNGTRDAETVVTGTLKFAADNVTIDGLEFEVSGNSRGVGPAATTGGTVTNSVFTAGDGIAATRGIQGDWYGEPANLTVSNNLFTTDFGLAGTENMSDLTVTGNVFETGTEAIGFGTGVTLADVSGNTAPEGQFVNYTADVIQLGTNTVGGTEFDGVTLGTNAADTIAEIAGSDELIVGQDGDDVVSFGGNFADYTVAVDDNGTITVTKGDETDTLTGVKAVKFADGFGVVDGLSIQDAIDLAAAGDTINVAAGVFDEAVNVNKDVSLVGANAGKTGFAGDRTTETVIAGQVIVSDGGAAINGFTLSKPTDSTTENGISFSGWNGINLVVTGDGASISNTIVEAFGGATFGGSGFVTLAAAATFEGNVVKAGTDYDAGADARGVAAVWINADADDAVTVSNNHLLVSTNVTGTPNDADALFLNNAGTVVIDGNLISGTDGGIVAFGDYGTLTISDNTIDTYAKTALRIFESMNDTKPDVILTGNTIDASGVSIVTIDGDVKLGTSGTGFPALATNFVGVPAIYRANDLSGDFGVFADGSFTLLADQDDAIAAAGVQGVIWSFADAQFKVFDGMSIQAAVNAADTGDTIIVGDGTFDRVTIDKGLTLTAADGETPTINGAGVNQGSGIRVEDGVDSVSINGFTVNATAGDLAAVYIVGNNTGVTLDGNTLNGGTSTALLTGGGVNDVSLNDNSLNVDGPKLAVYVNGTASLNNASTNVSLTGNTITGGADAGLLVGLESTGGTVTGNDFNGSASYAALELWGADNTVSGNTFDAFDTVILDQNDSYVVADLVANNTFVAPVIQLISEDGSGNVYNALSNALAAAQSGDVVKLTAGTLDLSGEDRLTVPAGVTLVGADPVDGALQTTISGGLLELLDGVSVSNLAFVDYDARLGGGQAVIEVSGAATVSGNTFTVDGASSAYTNEIRVTGENATITGNTITRDVAGDVIGSSIGNPGIFVSGVGTVSVTNNTLEQAIIGAVTAAGGVNLTITGNTVTPTVVSQDGIFITGPGFGAIPNGSVLDIAGNTFNANGDGDVLGLQLRGTATDAFDFADFGTIGNDFFQGGTGNDTFVVSAGEDLLDGGDGIDTVTIEVLDLTEITKSGADVLLGDDTLRNIERLETEAGQVVSLVEADGFTVLLEETETRPALRFADGDLQDAVIAVSGAGTVTNALTLEGGDYSSVSSLLFTQPFTLNATGDATLGGVVAPSVLTLTLTGEGDVTMGTFNGGLDASGLSGALVATAGADSSITGGSGVDVITIGAPFDAAGISENENGVLTYTATYPTGDTTFTLTGVETLVFDNTTVHVAGAGTNRGVQAAVDAAGPNDVVLIGNGTYAEVVTIASDKTGVKVLGSDDVTVTAFNVQADDVAIDGLTVLGGGNSSGSNAGVYVAANGVSLADLTLTGPGEEIDGGTSRGILTASAKGVGLTVDNVTASGWATGIYLNPGATGASVSDSIFSGNYVGMSIDGEDNVTLTGNIFGGTVEDLGLGGNGIASATANNFVSGKFGNFTGDVVTLAGTNVANEGTFDTIRLGQTNADDTIATDGLTSELVIGGGGVDTLALASGTGLSLVGIGLDGDGRTTISFAGANAGKATLESVEQVSQVVPEGGAGIYGSAPNAGDLVVFSLVADAEGFPVTVEGTTSRPALHFKAADLPAIALAAAALFADEDVVITLQDDVAYPGDIDLTAIDGGFNANKITINREGDSDVFIGPVFAPEGKVFLGVGVNFANVAPELAEANDSTDQGPDVVEGDDLGDFPVSDLLDLYKDDDVGSFLAGIAVTGIDSSGAGVLSGTWQFKEPNRSSYQDLEAFLPAELSEETALLLAQDTQLRFVADPSTEENPNFGTVPVLNFVAVDSTQPVVNGAQFTTPFGGRVADVTTRGGATPYSEAEASYSQTVTPANDPGGFGETVTFSLTSIAEDLFTQANGALDVQNGTLGSSVSDLFDAAFTDPDGSDTIAGVVIVANASAPELGQWQYSTDSGATWAAVGAVNGSSALFLDPAAELRFVPNWNFNGDAPALTVRSVDDTVNGLTSGSLVDASAVGRGTPFGLATATVGVEVEAAADTYTFGLDANGGTFTFGDNPGSVFTYEGVPVISLLNFDRENGDRDAFSFSMLDSIVLGLSDRVGGANVVSSTEANVLIDSRASIALDPDSASVANFFESALTSTGRDYSSNGPAPTGNELVHFASFTNVSAVAQGEGVGIFRDSAGVTSIWYAEEMNPFVAQQAEEAFEATLLGYLGGEDWSLAYQDDPDGNGTPTVTVEELQQFMATDFASSGVM